MSSTLLLITDLASPSGTNLNETHLGQHLGQHILLHSQ